ncbi:hypothetical protein T484DRAFT_1959960 [Baffinella frigidus]|nr:hypothetical protein T484DRAFT_1959960 [Cryptophyta sp. CCMP2293]
MVLDDGGEIAKRALLALERGEDLAAPGQGRNTQLHFLCETFRECNAERVEVVQRFLAKGAPVAATNLMGETPLHLACTPAIWSGTAKGSFSQEQRDEWNANWARIVGALLHSAHAVDTLKVGIATFHARSLVFAQLSGRKMRTLNDAGATAGAAFLQNKFRCPPMLGAQRT